MNIFSIDVSKRKERVKTHASRALIFVVVAITDKLKYTYLESCNNDVSVQGVRGLQWATVHKCLSDYRRFLYYAYIGGRSRNNSKPTGHLIR